MKIKIINEDSIKFDNGNIITFDHYQDCCEYNYADFEQLEDIAKQIDFDEDLVFEVVEESGFRFGNNSNMFFIPCYSEQNGYYTTEIDIYYNEEIVISLDCEWNNR